MGPGNDPVLGHNNRTNGHLTHVARLFGFLQSLAHEMIVAV
jgi:hypothetical protein